MRYTLTAFRLTRLKTCILESQRWLHSKYVKKCNEMQGLIAKSARQAKFQVFGRIIPSVSPERKKNKGVS